MTETIATYAGTRAILARYGLQTRKHLGQHFLIDPHVIQKIIRAADINKNDCVLEIGPGIGGLTQALAEHAGQVCAVELDAGLVPVLQAIFRDTPQVSIRQGDILQTDIQGLLAPYSGTKKIVANLPYYVTTPILMYFLENGENNPRFASLTVMVQREVAERLTAVPGTKDYGALTLAARFYADSDIVAYVPQNCFMPRPRVDSAVIQFTVLTKPRFDVPRELLFFLIRAAFAQRRKTLVNAWTGAADHWPIPIIPTKLQLAALLRQCGFSETIRGEVLALEDFVRLTEALLPFRAV